MCVKLFMRVKLRNHTHILKHNIKIKRKHMPKKVYTTRQTKLQRVYISGVEL